jgi:hypothetical protein
MGVSFSISAPGRAGRADRRAMTTFEEEVQAVLDGLPSQELVDRGVVVDALLDLFGAAGDDGERVSAALRDLPPAGLLERSVATSTLLGLLDPSSN